MDKFFFCYSSICSSIVTFKKTSWDIYLWSAHIPVAHKQYTGSTESFRYKFNNYKSAHRNFIQGNTVKQASFYAHFYNDKHPCMSDWEITLIDQADSVYELRRRESFWHYELDTFQPNGLKERDVITLFECNYVTFVLSSLSVVWPTIFIVAH